MITKEEILNLIQIARNSLVYSYCPYSHFPVACALLCHDDTIYTGCNVENAAYFGSICAERTAIVKAVSSGHRKFRAIAITSNLMNDICAPCGNCRQFMVEFGKDLIVILANHNNDEYKQYTINDLLPHSFGPENLTDYYKLIAKSSSS
ncbi:cytidine deaminase-like protein [Dermatophagoides farinae]|uniref:Cytidine deaminase n=2 Tax=Dermatophagoides farinae TaxID=6954 RepID=A0A9D4SHM4_DERFA|nr:cytidine deaminase-like protein [Dermatophagoides farinae]